MTENEIKDKMFELTKAGISSANQYRKRVKKIKLWCSGKIWPFARKSNA